MSPSGRGFLAAALRPADRLAATSASNAWPAGSTSNSHHGSFQTLILRWNGTAWK